MYRSNRNFNISPPPSPASIPRAFDTFAVLGGENLIIRVLQGWEFELHPQFHVKSLAWRAVVGDVVLEGFRGKDCAFEANWSRVLCLF